MRVGPFEIRRSVQAAEAAPRAKGEIGASGTVLLDGFLQQSEYNAELRGLNGVQKFRRMIDSDGSVQEALEHLYAPIRNATWTVEPPENPDDEELTAVSLVESALFEWPTQPWLEHLDGALEYLAYGHAVFEPAWQVIEKELRVPVLGEFETVGPMKQRVQKYRTLPPRQYLTLKRFAPRLQETIYRWHAEDGDLISIEQQALKNGDYGTWTIPAEDLLVLTHKRRGDEFTGKSILRAAHKAWVMKELIEKIQTIAMERHGVGLLIGYLPESMKDDDAALDRLETILQNVRAGAFNYIAVPGTKADGGRDGFTFEILSPTGGIPDFSNALNYQRAEIKAAVLARFSELGHQTTGARSVGDVQSIVWFAALHSYASFLSRAHQPIIDKIVDANLPNVGRKPTLKAAGIEARNLAEYAEAISRLVISGAVKPDKSFRSAVRKTADLPEEDEEDDSETPDPNVDDQGNPIEPETQPGDPNPKPKPEPEPDPNKEP